MTQDRPSIEAHRLSAAAKDREAVLAIALGTVVLAIVSAGAVAGWARHGEAIFLHLLEAGWAACF
ncbi:hypothetical protein VQ042_19085 [Aurantimonas sp. A2-1-M11]|uniref:hypothetical protein n=1 Tax=Aurantimonas sp. A2-1-M11 TaxID=3113712 RepID=UPI002F956D11